MRDFACSRREAPDSLQLRIAGEGDEAVVAAGRAAHAQEAVGEDAAAEKRPELALDEAGHGAVALPGAGEEGLELLAHDGVEHGLVGASTGVGRRNAEPARAGGRREHRIGGHSRSGLRAACRRCARW